MTDLSPLLRGMSPARLAVLAFLLRLALPALAVNQTGHIESVLTSDSAQYLAAAQSLVDRGRYEGPFGPELFRPPGYPALLAVGILLGSPLALAFSVQAFLGAVTSLLVYRAARALTGEAAARTACALAACHPVLVAWSGRVMAETLLAAFVALVALLFVRFHQAPSRRGLIWMGLAMGGAAYAKPIGFFLPAVVAFLLLAIPTPGRTRPGVRLANAAILLLVSGVVLMPWVVRNGLATGYWGFSTQLDRIVSFSAPASVHAAQTGRSFSDVRREVLAREQSGAYEYERGYGESRSRGVSTLLLNLPTYIPIHLRGVARTFTSPGAIPFFETFQLTSASTGPGADVLNQGVVAAARGAVVGFPPLILVAALLALVSAGVLLLALRGAVRRDIPSRGLRLGLALIALAIGLCSGGPWGQSRFRAPIVPFMCVLAACGAEPRRPRNGGSDEAPDYRRSGGGAVSSSPSRRRAAS